MSTYLGLLDKSTPPSQSNRQVSPLRISVFLLLIIFLAEVVSMVIISFIDFPNYMVETLADGLIMVLLIFPGIYYLQLQPLMRQISVRTRTESILRNTDKLLSKVLELLPVGVWITDKKGKIIHGNPAGQSIWEGARFVGSEGYGEYKGWWLDTGKPIQPEEWAVYRAINHGETSLNEEIEIESFDGSHKFILNSSIPILDEAEVIQGAIIVNQDITQRLKYEEELVKKNELLEKYFLTIDTLIAYLDKDFNFIRVNDTYANSGGHPPEFYIGKNHFDLYPHPENQKIFQHVVDTGESYSVLEKPFEYAEFPERGITYWDWSLHPVRGAKGDIEGLVLSLVDVTERRKAELQLERQNEELLELSKAERVNREFAESLVQATISLISSLELDQVLGSILEQVGKTIKYRSAGIVLVEENALRLASQLGFENNSEGLYPLQEIEQMEEYPLIFQALTLQQPVLVSSTKENQDWKSLPNLEWICSMMAAPLMIGDMVTGMILLTAEQEGTFNEADLSRLTAFTVPAALAIHNAQLYRAEFTARRASETLGAAVQSLIETLDIDHVIQTLLDYIHLFVHVDTAGVTLFEKVSPGGVRVVRGYGGWEDKADIESFPLDGITDSAIQRVISSRKSLIIPNVTAELGSDERTESQKIHHWLLLPLVSNEQMIGFVEAGNASEKTFAPEEIHWAEALVAQAGVAIQNASLFEQVQTSKSRLQSLARKLVDVQESERNHIARELHDEAGQSLSSLKLSLGRLEHDPGCPAHISQRLYELKQLVDHVLEDLHRLAMDLRPAALDHLGLIAALEQLTNKLNSEQLSIRFNIYGFEGERLSQVLETSIYRIIQEALTNAIRHSQASNLSILLEKKAGQVRIYVEDNGVGFDLEDLQIEGHLGLAGMRERAEMMGGRLTIDSAPGKGTSILLEVPDAPKNPHS
jgi:PAS domain S-box-containing protein